MNDTPNSADTQSAAGANSDQPLSAKRVTELQAIAQGLGIKGAARMRKTVLIEAIESARAGNTGAAAAAADSKDKSQPAAEATQTAPKQAEAEAPKQDDSKQDAAKQSDSKQDAPQRSDAAAEAQPEAESTPKQQTASRRRRVTTQSTQPASKDESAAEAKPEADATPAKSESGEITSLDQIQLPSGDSADDEETKDASAGQRGRSRSQRGRQQQSDRQQSDRQQSDKADSDDKSSSPKTLDDIILPPAREEDEDQGQDSSRGDNQSGSRKRNRNRNRGKGQQNDDQSQKQDEQQSSRQQQSGRGDDQKPNQNQRQRDRKRNHRDDADPEVAPDDVLLPIAGILDVLDNYAFVRTSGYLAGVNDVYVSLGQVKKYGLRKGDAIVGAIRQPREGEHQGGRQKYNALVRVDTINGEAPDTNRVRPEFDKLTPLYPNERLQLETESGHAAQRMVDLFAPIGKGTRGLIIAPPKSGKSIMLERIANAIAQNSPDTHLMLVLVDERPEEVTRLERTIQGEVVASTFDMPAENHTTIAELAIERAKRLVELGLDVVMLLDSITQLCRAYNLTAPASGRIIAGGVDASALYPPKRFFGAARKVENGGSLTILATAMVETGSRTDEVILEEFVGTGNMELRLSREIADKRIFPALDIQQSSTLHEEQLLSPNELEVTWGIRRALHGDAQASLEAVLERISSTSSNEDFLSSVRANPISPVSAQ
ncbi:MAG: transcription termination factor Rho [Gulosibacter sp.]|uniref:transcription termination factor Rho n=1 Tax=Gulosibacter sp. TaxID=2817531 RepID=UPI003F93EF11